MTAVEECLERIAEREEAVHAWAFLDPDAALDQARRREMSTSRGPLHGVPVGVKDIFDTADMPTEYGSAIYRGNRPDRDAAVVARLRTAGAVILGKTATTEFAALAPTETRNPRALAHSPGGSSSGSAAAVADGMVPLALGTQTVGSTVRPASYCGVVGFKPSFGAVPFRGAKPLSPSQDTVGLFARDVEGVELLMRGLGVETAAAADPVWSGGRRPTIALMRNPWWAEASGDARRSVEEAMDLAAAAGARITEIPFPDGCEAMVELQIAISEFETARSLRAEYSSHRGELSDALVALIERGQEVSPEAHRSALAARGDCSKLLETAIGSVDAVATLAASGEAPAGLRSTGDPILARPWTLVGWPAISVPGMHGSGGLPIGVQLVAPHGRDAGVLGAARWLQEALRPAQ